MTDGYAKHRHTYITGPESKRPGTHHFEHSHEGGDCYHRHQDTGPAYFAGGISRAKRTKRPVGLQLAYVEPAEHERTFRVIFVDEYTPGHTSAGIGRAQWERERAAFIAAMHRGGPDSQDLTTEARMVNEFGMTPIYEVVKP